MKQMPITIPQFARKINRSSVWVRNAVRLGRFSTVRIGNYVLLDPDEADRFNREPFKISRRELGQ